MRVAYVTAKDPGSRWSWSGTNHAMFQALPCDDCGVVHVGRSLHGVRRWLPRRVDRLVNRLLPPEESADLLDESRRCARVLAPELSGNRFDVIFAPVASREIAFLDTDLPIVYLSDATFKVLRDCYPEVAGKPKEWRDEREACERRAIARADLLIYPSRWAADSAVSDYGADPEKVRVIPFGANIHDVPPLDAILERRPNDGVCRLLFVGKDWSRKGGDIVVEALRALQGMGVRAELAVCGAMPAAVLQSPDIVFKGVLDKNRKGELAELVGLLTRANFMIVPSRGEAFGIVFCEASAFGIPSLSTRTGGIPGAIEDGVNGLLFPLEARGTEYAGAMAGLLEDRDRYDELVRSSRRLYDERLNWSAWSRRVRFEMGQLIERSASA